MRSILEYVFGMHGDMKIDPTTNQKVAIKKGYSANRITKGISYTLIHEISFLKEFMICQHPNIVKVANQFSGMSPCRSSTFFLMTGIFMWWKTSTLPISNSIWQMERRPSTKCKSSFSCTR